MKIDKRQIKRYIPKILKWYLIGLIVIPLFLTITSVAVNQFQDAVIDGKGGYERSISHPFICLSSPIPDTPGERYCGYLEFFTNLFTFWGYWFGFGAFIWKYIIFSWIILPTISIFIYFKNRKKFVASQSAGR